MPVLGVGNPDPNISKKILELELKTGVFKKVVGCQDFNPMSDAAKRQVVVHNDFKPDNVLRNPDTGDLTAIDYDLVQVGSAVMDFGLPYMMWLGSRYTTFQFRRSFIESYLLESGLPAEEIDVKEMMLDCEVNTIVAFPGLLAKIYDAEVPLLRGVKHPTTKTGFEASDQNATPSGPELIDLLSTAIQKIRADEQLVDRCLRNGLVVTMFKEEAFGSKVLNSWLKEMQKNKMLRLFGIAETDNGEIYVAEHARN
jgi:serine/threonine protein kinase